MSDLRADPEESGDRPLVNETQLRLLAKFSQWPEVSSAASLVQVQPCTTMAVVDKRKPVDVPDYVEMQRVGSVVMGYHEGTDSLFYFFLSPSAADASSPGDSAEDVKIEHHGEGHESD